MRAVPDAVVGIGTVLTPADLARSAAIGAQFALSPGATPGAAGCGGGRELAVHARRGNGFRADGGGGARLRHGQVLPGRDDRRHSGPARPGRPFPRARFCPTGGVHAQNLAEWLAVPNVVAVGGSWLTPASDVKTGNWTVIEGYARQAAAL